MSAQEVQVIVNALKYVTGLPDKSETRHILALYDPAIPESKTQAESFVKQLSLNKNAKTLKITAATGTLQDAQSINAALLYIPSGFSVHYKNVSELSGKKHLFPITTNKDCVMAKACALSFSVGESVEIFISEDALKAFGFDVDAAFRFMARPI